MMTRVTLALLLCLLPPSVAVALEARPPTTYLWAYYYLPTSTTPQFPRPASVLFADINDAGDVPVQRFITPPLDTAFVLHGGGFTLPLTCADGRKPSVAGINNRWDVVGACVTGNHQEGVVLRLQRDAYVEDRRVMVSTAYSTFPRAINDWGWVVGIYYDGATLDGPFAFLAVREQITTFGPFGMAPAAITNWGGIVGSLALLEPDTVRHQGFYYYFGQLFQFDVPGARDTFVMDANDLGEMVGVYQTEDSVAHSFYFTRGQWLDIASPDPHVLFTEVTGINNHGQLTGRVIVAHPRQSPLSPPEIELGFIATPLHPGAVPAVAASTTATATATATAARSQALVAEAPEARPQVTLNTSSCTEGLDATTGRYRVVPLALRQQLGCTN